MIIGGNKMEECKVENLYNLDETIAKDIFEGVTYPWEVLPKLEEFIINLGKISKSYRTIYLSIAYGSRSGRIVMLVFWTIYGKLVSQSCARRV